MTKEFGCMRFKKKFPYNWLIKKKPRKLTFHICTGKIILVGHSFTSLQKLTYLTYARLLYKEIHTYSLCILIIE